jgi:hypothetical protein
MGSSEAAETWAIAALKAKYLRLLNTRRWDEVSSLFTGDVRYELPFLGKFDDMEVAVRAIREGFGDVWSFYGGFIPEISIVSATRATGIFAMSSHTKKEISNDFGRSFGYYYDEFRKVDGTWLISSLRLVSSYNSYPER